MGIIMLRETGFIGELLFVLSIFVVLILILHLLLWVLKNSKSFSYSYVKVMMISLVISLSILSYFFVPHPEYDLTKHFNFMNDIRNSGKTVFELLEEAFMFKQYVGHYPNLVFYNVIRNVIVFSTDDNSWLPVIVTAIVYSIFTYITFDYLKKYNIKLKWMFFAFIISFSSMPLLLVVSGMRCALAFSFVGLAVYLKEEKNCSWILFALLCFIGLTTHNSVIMPIVI